MIMFEGEGFCAVFEFELMSRWVPKDPEASCSVVKDTSTSTTTNSSLTPTALRVSGDMSMSTFLTRPVDLLA
jgi:hypothetical protein